MTNNTITMTQEELQAIIANAVQQGISATKKPVARKANTRATVKASAGDLVAKMATLGLEPKADVWLHTSQNGRSTLFCQFSKSEEAELELMAECGFENWANKDSKRDMWQTDYSRIVRMYADIESGCEGNYEMFRR
jgi:hypothetical protein